MDVDKNNKHNDLTSSIKNNKSKLKIILNIREKNDG
jgi:hypothetical protein